MKTRKFVDSAVLYAKAGSGGNGSVSFRREKFVPMGGPDGGDGGRGGNVILEGDPDVDSLVSVYFEPHQRAQDGGHGRGQRMTGRDGADRIVRVPLGTVARLADTGEILGELIEAGARLTVAQGGKGGRGNWHWKSSTNRSPRQHTDGDTAEEFTIRLDLKIMADAGLVGFPNAGKSSILSLISEAHPKVAPYPFTTLNPIIGTVVFEDYSLLTVADIPGLIHGASEGAGLGDAFLRHVERASILIFVLDMAGSEGRSPVDDYRNVLNELRLYDESLVERRALVVANKMDLPDAAENLAAFRRETGLKPIEFSTVTGDGIEALKTALHHAVARLVC